VALADFLGSLPQEKQKGPKANSIFIVRQRRRLRLWLPCERKASACGLRLREGGDGYVVAYVPEEKLNIIRKHWRKVLEAAGLDCWPGVFFGPMLFAGRLPTCPHRQSRPSRLQL
jgi:hypothetical protein